MSVSLLRVNEHENFECAIAELVPLPCVYPLVLNDDWNVGAAPPATDGLLLLR